MNKETILKLLDAYYDGTTTAAEVDALKRYFVETDNIPADLEVDAVIFRAMAAKPQAPVPADLQEKILKATLKARPRRRLLLWDRMAAAAAVAAVIVTLGMLFMRREVPQAAEKIAQVTQIRQVRPNDEPPMPEPHETRRDARPVRPRVTNHGAGAKVVPAPKVTVDTIEPQLAAADPYREVTDSAQVCEITEQVLAKIDSSFDLAMTGLNETEMMLAIAQDPLNAAEIRRQYSEN